MSAPVPLSAKNCKIRVNGAICYGQKWQATPEAAMLDTSNFEGQGYEDQIAGLKKLDIHVEGWFDGAGGANNPYESTLNLNPGAVITIDLYTNDLNSPGWHGTALVKGQPMIVDVHEKVMFSFDAKMKGAFSSPTATTTTTTTST